VTAPEPFYGVLDPTNPLHVEQARAVLAAAGELEQASRAAATQLPRVRVVPTTDLIGIQVTHENVGQVRDELLPGAAMLEDGTLRFTRSTGLQHEVAPGDVLVLLPSGPWAIYSDELGLIWDVAEVTS
jgi:hypothetical protein